LKLFSLKANIGDSKGLNDVSLVTDGLIGDVNRAQIQPGLADNDLLVCDLTKIDGSLSDALFNNKHHIAKRITGGAVLLCFAGPPRTLNRSNYQWLNELGLLLLPEALSAQEIKFSQSFPFSKLLTQKQSSFSHLVVFNGTPDTNAILATNNSADVVGIYKKYGRGHIFIMPWPENQPEFISYFVNEILPLLKPTFILSSTNSEQLPQHLNDLKIPGQEKLLDSISREEERIKSINSKVQKLHDKFTELENWKGLLWQTGKPLENTVKRFFEHFFGLTLVTDEVDLVGEYEKRELFIEVKGNTGGIDHRKDFRQIHERKTYNAKDPQNTFALLVGNPFRLEPLNNRPPSGQNLFALTSIPIAESAEIGLIPTTELFKVLTCLLLKKTLNKKKILDGIIKCKGVYTYKKKTGVNLKVSDIGNIGPDIATNSK